MNLSFSKKIALLMTSAFLGIAIVSGLSVLQMRTEIVEGRKAALRTAVESAHSIVVGYQAKAAAGKINEGDAKKAALDALRISRYGATNADYFYVFGLDISGVMHPIKTEWDGTNLLGKVKDAQGVDIVKALADGLRNSKDGTAFVDTMFPRPKTTEAVPKLQYVIAVPGWGWMVGSGLYMDDVNAQVRNAALHQLLAGFAVLAAIGTASIMLKRSVFAQLGGDPQKAMEIMDQVSGGNLDVRLPDARKGSLLDGLQRMVSSVRQTMVQVRSATDSIGTASAEIATGNQDLSVRTERTASNLQQAASSVEQLTSTVKQSAESARHANQLAFSAAEIAARGGVVVSQVVVTMDEINASSKKIADIISVIDGIAFQTNILALNAAVEAARAGEQGRGFAVVASEVRSLAQRSAAAAKEIKTLIGDSVGKVDDGSKLVADAGKTMTEIVSSVKRVSDIIGEITAAAGEQSQGIDEVNQSVSQLDQMTQQNAALVEESAAAAQSLKDQTVRLSQVVDTFHL
ncbi:methyl-accepting chemotaxis protein [Rhizobacter sp. Root404]|uniref:methyl-accepting chemotaxis protein n=1 Tax=Rhizobacter sp. Root404 TaxID=1736528 RepID=UPI0006FFD5F2|nr:methyl-accepting chemotaxis protein [Rhizobacter sp. Root404]KQW38421.1 chemotaxis protein [Rhizobacter sp. Root404]